MLFVYTSWEVEKDWETEFVMTNLGKKNHASSRRNGVWKIFILRKN